jgi:hypothetical protein
LGAPLISTPAFELDSVVPLTMWFTAADSPFTLLVTAM